MGDVDSLNLLGTDDGRLIVTDSGVDIEITTLGTPFGPNVLADDVTFITGPVAAPMNTNSTIPPAIPAPPPPSVPAPLVPGSTPAWVTAFTAPSGALPSIVLDFQNGQYWAGGAVQTSAILVQLAAYGTWDPTTIVAGKGLIASTNANATIATSFTTALIGGCTILLKVANFAQDATHTVMEADLLDTTFTTDGQIYIGQNGSGFVPFSRLTAYSGSNVTDNAPAIVPTSSVAANITQPTFASSLEGRAVVTIASGTPSPAVTNIGVSNFPSSLGVSPPYITQAVFWTPQAQSDLPAISLL